MSTRLHKDEKQPIVTRFPPSPTGHLHLGGARTALFNWLYARHTDGRFVLRFEDTDKARSSRIYVDNILEALAWMGIDWDEGPYFQSQRSGIYQTHIQKLLDSKQAYFCNCPSSRLENLRKEALASGGKPKYDGMCRDKTLSGGQNRVVRFKVPLSGRTIIHDVIKGNVAFKNSELDDFIIARSDGSPTYNFVVVVDDITMGINTVIRGDDHVMNTPKQILMYRALEHPLPVFGHVPMVFGNDRSRLSKRHGAMSVLAYRDMGYLPDAFINYLVRLGWSYGDQEFFNRNELIEKFSLDRIGQSPGVFNPEKLLALNADHIQATSPKKLAGWLMPFLKKRDCVVESMAYLEKAVSTLTARSKTLEEMADGVGFYLKTRIEYEVKAARKFLKPDTVPALEMLAGKLSALEGFTQKELETVFKTVMDQTGLKLGKIAQPVRVALTGKTASPGIFEIIEVLGKERVVSRITQAVKYMLDQQDVHGTS